MAIFYFKNLLLLAMFMAMTSQQVLNAQIVPVESTYKAVTKPVEKSKANISNSKKAVSLKLDAKGRAYYIDQQGDKVIILDYQTRRSMQEVSSYNTDKPIKGKMYSQSFYKETVPDLVEEVKPGFKVYVVKEGDTWISISQKLFGTDKQWAQLQLWNEELLSNPKIPEGAKIKYKDFEKK